MCRWDKVTVTLVDERWVDESSDRSNGRLVRANLLTGPGGGRAVRAALSGRRPSPMRWMRAGTGAARGCRSRSMRRSWAWAMTGIRRRFFPGGDTLARGADGRGAGRRHQRAGGGRAARDADAASGCSRRAALYLHIEGEEKVETLRQGGGGRSRRGHARPCYSAPDPDAADHLLVPLTGQGARKCLSSRPSRT